MQTTELAHFFSGLESMLQNSRKFLKENSLEYAIEFNPLIHFYGIGENRTSDIFAFFLNPNEKHGQGDLFLDIFLSSDFGWKEKVSNFKKVTIHREKQTLRQRRLDLLLDFDGKYGIGIENKIWAIDQEKQLSDYNEWLINRYGKDNYTLLYLTPYGKLPSNESISKEEFDILFKEKKLLLLDHSSSISELIKLWTEKCQADKIRQFLKDFQQFINHTVNGNIFMTEHKTIKEYILDGNVENRLAIAIGIDESMDMVYSQLIEMLKSQLVEVADRHGLELNFNLKKELNWTGFSFKLPQDLPSLEIRFEWANRFSGFYGFLYDSNNLILGDLIKKNFGEIDNKSWQWARNLDKYKHFNSQTYIDIQNGNFSMFIDEKLKEILVKAKNLY